MQRIFNKLKSIHILSACLPACCNIYWHQAYWSSFSHKRSNRYLNMKSIVSKNVYPQHHSLSFGHSFYQLILLQTKVSEFNISQTFHRNTCNANKQPGWLHVFPYGSCCNNLVQQLQVCYKVEITMDLQNFLPCQMVITTL